MHYTPAGTEYFSLLSKSTRDKSSAVLFSNTAAINKIFPQVLRGVWKFLLSFRSHNRWR